MEMLYNFLHVVKNAALTQTAYYKSITIFIVAMLLKNMHHFIVVLRKMSFIPSVAGVVVFFIQLVPFSLDASNCIRLRKRYTLTSICTVVVCFLSFVVLPASVYAEGEGMSITIAPPLFQLNLQPGETWSSYISVVNNNGYDVTLYADPVLFKPSGESGTPVFITAPSSADTVGDTSSLVGWISVPQDALPVRREQTYQLPITISVPLDAAPGGHYAAVLIGNRAPEGSGEGSTVNVTSSIAALIFLSVSGDVVEKGLIRDFVTEKTVYETAKATLSLRFENRGNVHLLPQGNIVIYNMFGKERGTIPINQHRDYGNVLPESIRKFSFTWESDAGIWDIGRYKAEATIGYGKDAKQSALATTYFYVLPIVPLLQVIGGLLALVFFVGWAIRAYIRRALMLETSRLSRQGGATTLATVRADAPKLKLGTLVQPIQAGFVDLRRVGTAQSVTLRSRSSATTETHVEVFRFSTFLYKYRRFFFFILVGLVGAFGIHIFIKDITTTSRDFSVAEVRSDGSVVDISSQENTE